MSDKENSPQKSDNRLNNSDNNSLKPPPVPYKIINNDESLLFIKLTPASKANSIKGIETDLLGDTYIKVTVTEIPENGKANKALIKLLSKHYNIPKSSIQIHKGEKSRLKILKIKQPSQYIMSIFI